MHLKKLACEGFKSFADPIAFDFEPGMTAIVGPNGCGKSNVVDAFRWVLGERSAKGLRGQEMLDVIFKGTRKRDPLGRAEVSLVFENEDRTLPLDQNEVEITRRLYRSGESEYLINRRKCRLKDVLALFTGTGIGTDGYSVLEQGSVDGFLSANPQERRSVFEEAAGISKYKKDRQQSMRQLERVEQNLARTGDVLSEVERRLQRIRQQAARAERFIADRDRYRVLRAIIGHEDMEAFLEARQLASYTVQELEARRSLISELGTQRRAERDRARNALDEAQQQLTHLREVAHELERGQQRIDQRRDHIGERRVEMEDARTKRDEVRAGIEETIAEYDRRRSALRETLRESIARIRELRQSVEQSEEQRRALSSERDELVDELSEAKRTGVEAAVAESRGSNDIVGLDGEIAAAAQREAARRTERDGFVGERQELDRRVEATTSLRSSAEARRARAIEDARLLSSEIARRTASLDATERDAAEVRDAVEKTRARLAVLEDMERSREGIGSGARRLLEPDLPFHREALGLLADHIRAPKAWAGLVDAALGDAAQIVCFWSDSELADRVRHVRSVLDDSESAVIAHVGLHAPRVEPIRGGRPSRLEERNEAESVDHGELNFGSGSERARHLIDEVTTHPAVRPLVEALIGDVIVVEDLEEAFERRDRGEVFGRMLTRRGDLVDTTGVVQIRPSEGTGLISRRTELASLKETLAEQTTQFRRLDETGTSLRGTIEARIAEERRAEEQAQRDQIEIESCDLRLEELAREKQRYDERLEAISGELDELRTVQTTALERRERVQQKLVEISQRRVAAENRVLEAEERMRELDRRAEQFSDELSALRVSATQAEERASGVRREERRLVAEIEERKARIAALDHDASEDAARLESFDTEEAALEAERVELEESLAQNSKECDSVNEVVIEDRQIVHDIEHILGRISEEEDSLRSDREKALLDDGQLEIKIAGIRSSLQEELELDLADCPVDDWRKEQHLEDESAEDFSRRIRAEIEEIAVRLKRNANVNLEAVEELAALEDRFETLSRQIEDLDSSREQLEQITEELNTKCRDLFASTFETTRQHFQELFQTIFGGGSSDLVLVGDDPLEAGIEVKASPPGKRINSLKLMSGGEKALTAVAVLFALFRTRPSPFCLLDEVDAPLDEANNRRYIRILQEFANEAQFLVVTHSKITMTEAERLYGVTMEEEGVSRTMSVRLEDAHDLADDSPQDQPVSAIRHPLAAR